eukprot:960104-Amorphochlora_amoeboformis.AAC.1
MTSEIKRPVPGDCISRVRPGEEEKKSIVSRKLIKTCIPCYLDVDKSAGRRSKGVRGGRILGDYGAFRFF